MGEAEWVDAEGDGVGEEVVVEEDVESQLANVDV